jgi:Ras-related protein Rab-5C
MYYRSAACAICVYDITQSVSPSPFVPSLSFLLQSLTASQASLEKAKSWIRELQRQADPSIVIALCGNKSDLAARRQVSQEEAQKFAEEEGLMWCETSAKSGEGVNEIFDRIGASCLPSFQLRLLSPASLKEEEPKLTGPEAHKLPEVAPPQAQRGASAAKGPGGAAKVDLNKNSAGPGTPESCNC